MLKLHPDKCKHPRAEEASKHLNSLRDKHVSMTRSAEARSANTRVRLQNAAEQVQARGAVSRTARPPSPPPPPRGEWDPNADDDEDEDSDDESEWHNYPGFWDDFTFGGGEERCDEDFYGGYGYSSRYDDGYGEYKSADAANYAPDWGVDATFKTDDGHGCYNRRIHRGAKFVEAAAQQREAEERRRAAAAAAAKAAKAAAFVELPEADDEDVPAPPAAAPAPSAAARPAAHAAEAQPRRGKPPPPTGEAYYSGYAARPPAAAPARVTPASLRGRPERRRVEWWVKPYKGTAEMRKQTKLSHRIAVCASTRRGRRAAGAGWHLDGPADQAGAAEAFVRTKAQQSQATDVADEAAARRLGARGGWWRRRRWWWRLRRRLAGAAAARPAPAPAAAAAPRSRPPPPPPPRRRHRHALRGCSRRAVGRRGGDRRRAEWTAPRRAGGGVRDRRACGDANDRDGRNPSGRHASPPRQLWSTFQARGHSPSRAVSPNAAPRNGGGTDGGGASAVTGVSAAAAAPPPLRPPPARVGARRPTGPRPEK